MALAISESRSMSAGRRRNRIARGLVRENDVRDHVAPPPAPARHQMGSGTQFAGPRNAAYTLETGTTTGPHLSKGRKCLINLPGKLWPRSRVNPLNRNARRSATSPPRPRRPKLCYTPRNAEASDVLPSPDQSLRQLACHQTHNPPSYLEAIAEGQAGPKWIARSNRSRFCSLVCATVGSGMYLNLHPL
jgi:hypothetical protein